MAGDEHGLDEVARQRFWRRVRTSLTLLVLVGVVIGAAWYGWRNVLEDEEPAVAATDAPCAPNSPGAAPAPASIRVNVYNATTRNGLAASVARQLRQLGYNVIDVDNDPLAKSIEAAGEVRAHIDQQAAAGALAALLPGAAFVPDDRDNDTVDLVLGDGFKNLAKDAAPADDSDLPACAPPS
jgi:hypothetical protein